MPAAPLFGSLGVERIFPLLLRQGEFLLTITQLTPPQFEFAVDALLERLDLCVFTRRPLDLIRQFRLASGQLWRCAPTCFFQRRRSRRRRFAS